MSKSPVKTKGRILLCEDDIPTLAQLQKTFGMLGCEVVTATTGTVALYKLRQGGFDLVIMDYHMPLRDASQTMVEFSSEGGNSMPMVLISAEDHQRSARELGFTAFYPKPITFEVAEKIVARFLPER